MRSRCLILTAAVLLCACGAKGPLYLPQTHQANPPASPAAQADITPKPAPQTTPAPATPPAESPRP